MLGRNVWVGRYEIDLIVCRGRVLVFSEVKSKSSLRFGDPLEMVTAEKQRRIRRAAECWLARNAAYRDYRVRFDIVAVRGRALQCVQDAF